MDQLALFNQKQTITMSSREIAELVGSQHSHIKISAERLFSKGLIGTLATREFDHNGNIYTEYLLNKRDSIVLVAQNCPEFMTKIIDRWQELEAKESAVTALPDFTDPAVAARAWADQYEQREALQAQNDTLKPKAAIADRIHNAHGLQSLAEAAKILGTGQNRLFAKLRGECILLPDNTPYQEYINRGYFVVKERPYGDDGELYARTYVTGKGLIWLTERLNDLRKA
jgi:phage antirepressor YoqD-like protein